MLIVAVIIFVAIPPVGFAVVAGLAHALAHAVYHPKLSSSK